MKILWLTWKDKKNPLAGGAESINQELAKRLVQDGHEVIFIVAGYKGASNKEDIDGYKIIRLGNRWTVYWRTFRYYKRNLIGWADLVIDEINTIPFFTKFYVNEKNILFVHQLCRKIWFYEMLFPLNLIGYLLEPVYLWQLRDREVISVSKSTRNDLLKYGFKKENISIISEGIEIEPLKELPVIEEVKEKEPAILFLGAIKPMKRPDQVIKAFELAKQNIKNLKLWIAGGNNEKYCNKIVKLIDNSKYKKDITYHGKVVKEEKIRLFQKAHLLCVTSVKEGWGLVVTEANSQGTPAVVYNVDGLRDSVKNKETGFVCEKNTPQNLSDKITQIIQDKILYKSIQKNAWEWSRNITFENSYEQFKFNIEKIVH